MKVWLFAPKKRVEDGYGNSTSDIQEALERRGIEVSREAECEHDVILIYGPPEYLKYARKISFKPIVMFTMWETEEPPKEWREYLQAADQVLNPSPWGTKVFNDYFKLEKPCEYVPLGYHDSFIPMEREEDREVFTFLMYNSGFGAIRKGFFEVVEAFKKAFTPNDPVKLIIKSSRPEYFKSNSAIWHGMQDAGRYKNMEYLPLPYSREGLRLLLQRSDCFIFPSRGEGFGHTPLEAMATGITAIIPNKHGMAQYYNPDLHYTYQTHRKKAQFDRKGDYGDWDVADVGSLSRVMRYVFEHQKEARKRGTHCPAWASQWNYDRTATMLIENFNKVLKTI